MNGEYIIIPQDQVKPITIPMIQPQNITNVPIINKNPYTPYSYKYKVIGNKFVKGLINIEITLYLGTRFYGRRTTENQFISSILIIEFKLKDEDPKEIETEIWDYILSLGDVVDLKQLRDIEYSATVNSYISSKSAEDVMNLFKGIKYL